MASDAGRSAATSPLRSRIGTVALAAVGAGAFAVLATLNAGGYRFGESDQAFYMPVVAEQMTPALFPHDRPLIAAQDRFLLFDDWFAPLVEVSGLSLEVAFLIAQAVTLAVLFVALVWIGRALFRSRWTTAGLIVLTTIRHRIPHTGANSVEGYFHPRMLGFAIGLSAVALYLHGRVRWALALVGVAALVHPTIGAWFAVLLLGAVAVHRDLPLGVLVAGVAGGLVVGLATLGGALADGLVLMDETWLSILALKDYLVIRGWPLAAWPSNLAITAFVLLMYRYRRALGLATSREGALVAGCVLLLLVFLVSAPFSYARVALAVQLQVNRVFWLIDYLAVALFAWLLFEAPWRPAAGRPRGGVVSRRALVVVIALLAMWRGGYRGFVERPERPVFSVGLVQSDWHGLMEWARSRPVGTHFLADPSHAARYGTSVRVAAQRDVYLELVKDSALAIYSSEVAARVARRIRDLGDFEGLTEARAAELARRYDLDFLITEQALDLPLARSVGALRAYRLPGAPPGEP